MMISTIQFLYIKWGWKLYLNHLNFSFFNYFYGKKTHSHLKCIMYDMLDLENISKEIRDLENVCKKFITHVTYHPPHSYSNNTTTPNDFFFFFLFANHRSIENIKIRERQSKRKNWLQKYTFNLLEIYKGPTINLSHIWAQIIRCGLTIQ